MGKDYKHLKFEENVVKDFQNAKRLYELQDNKRYSHSEILAMLIAHRKKSQFLIPGVEKMY